MSPRFPTHDHRNVGTAQGKLGGDGLHQGTLFAKFPDCHHLLIRYFCTRPLMEFSPLPPFFRMKARAIAISSSIPFLRMAISRVGLDIPREIVRPIAARWVIAGVANVERVRVFAGIQKHGDPMGLESLHVYGKVPIALSVTSSHPRPALIRSALVYLGPKPGDVFLRNWRQWLTIVSRHAISLGSCVRAVAALRVLRGSFYFSTPETI